MKKRSFASLVAAGLVFLSACSSDSTTTTPPENPSTGTDDAITKEALKTFVHLAHERYARSLEKARLMRDAIESVLAAPSENGLAAARVAWIEARAPYGETEAFRFFGGPIDDENGPEGRVNAWPLESEGLEVGSPHEGGDQSELCR